MIWHFLATLPRYRSRSLFITWVGGGGVLGFWLCHDKIDLITL